MIDFINVLNLAVSSTELEQNEHLQGSWIIESKNGEIIKQEVNYFGLTFSVKNNNVRLSGSIHHYFNLGRHNYNDFPKKKVKDVVNQLSKEFKIDLQKSRLNGIEFGVNVVLPFEPKGLLDSLITHKGEPFNREVEEGKIFYVCKHKHFYLKIYDKGLQHLLVENILRFEIRVRRMQFFESKGIELVYLSDLLNNAIYPKLGEVLKAYFDEILFDDRSINPKELNATEREIYLRGQNPKTWITDSRTPNEQKELQRLREKFVEILDRHRIGLNFTKVVSEKIESKWFELSEIYQPSKGLAGGELSEIYRLSEVEENTQKMLIVRNLHFKYKENFGQPPNQQKISRCAYCRKNLESSSQSYCNDKCKAKKGLLNARSNPNHDTKKKLVRITIHPSLFEQEPFLKIDEAKIIWLQQHGINIKGSSHGGGSPPQ